MAKHCTVCNRDYADDLATCPHCAAAKQTQLAGRGQERATQLVNRGDERHTRLSPEEAAAKKKQADLIDLSAESPKKPSKTPLDSSVVDLGALPDEVAENESDVVVAELASNASPVEPVGDSAINLGSSPADSGVKVEVAEGSGIDVEDAAVSTASAAAHPSSSDFDLGAVATAAPGSGIDVGGNSHQPESISDIDLESMEPEAAEEPAIAEMEETPADSEEEAATSQEAEIAESEEPAAAESEENEKPAKAAKPRSSILALAGSALVGVVVGAGGLMGVQALTGSGDKPKQSAMPMVPQNRPAAGAAAPVAATFEMQAARVASGDLDEAKAAGIEQVQGANAKELVALGEYRLLSYLKNAGAKINLQDPNLQPAIQNLQKAAEQKDPDAVYDLAHIKELAGQLPEARNDYAKGAETFAGDATQKRRFEAAISRVDWKMSMKAAGAVMAPRSGDRALMLALLFIALQQAPGTPQQPAPPPAAQGKQPAAPAAQAEKQEAGFEFWQAAKLAHDGKFSDAVAALDKARKMHDQQRFTRLRKAQNPLSDPAEDIFLRCCDELKAYWQLENRLREGGYLTDKNTPADAIQAMAQKGQGSDTKVKELTDKLTAAQKGQKDSDAAVAELKPKLQKATEENTKLAADLKAKEQTIKDRDAALTAAKDQNTKLKGDYDAHNATLAKIRTELASAQLLDAKGKADVSEAVKKAIDVAKTKDAEGMLRRQRSEIEQLSASLKETRQPQELLPMWSLLLDENRSRSELANQAILDANRVLRDPRATAGQKGEAEVVLGLALRNTGKFSEAKKALEAARGAVDNGDWRGRADAALREVSNPASYFTSQAQDFYDTGRMEAALAALDRAMKVLPAKEQVKLLAQRSLIELDAAQSKSRGKLSAAEPLLVAAGKDAEAAIKAGAAEGHYAAGRIAEELGRVDAAIKSYRAALAAHGSQLDAKGARYRMALARVLLLPRTKAVLLWPENRSSLVSDASQKRRMAKTLLRSVANRPESLVWMMVLGLQAPLLLGDEPGQEEAEKLADEVLKAPSDTLPFTVLAQALAVKGRWSQALQVYVEGIRPMLPREYGNGLVYLLRNDPRLKRPSSLRTPNPFAAEKHFGAGLNYYFDRDYGNAEKELLLAVENDSQDARYFYFLGMSRLSQNRRRDAFADLDQGVMLERMDRPSSAAVSASLERIQGPMRYLVNGFRERPQR